MSASWDNRETLKNMAIGTAIGSLATGKCALALDKVNGKDVSKVMKAANKIIKKTNLKQKGLYIENLTDIKQTDFSHLPSILNPDARIAKGKNAAFRPLMNNIGINMNKNALSVFHEIGHAYNYNNTALKYLQLSKPAFTISAFAFALSPLFIEKTPEWKKEERTFAEKIKDGICENAPWLAVAAYSPILIEEGIASVRAAKFAKPLLKPNLFRKMNAGNLLAFSTYLLGTVSLFLIGKMTSKAKE